MSSTENDPPSTSAPIQGDLLPPPEMALRVSQAEFAKIMGVSRAAVSKWVKDGKIRPGVDGRFCPRQAAKSLLATTEPTRLRARVLRDVAEETQTLREENARLKSELATLRKTLRVVEKDANDFFAQSVVWPELLLERWQHMANAKTEDERRDLIEILTGECRARAEFKTIELFLENIE